MPTPLYLTAELRDIERKASADLPPRALMRRAGERAAAWLVRRADAADAFVVVCGTGNNGGDGYECAATLRERGRDVVCVALGAPGTDDARAARARWDAVGGTTLTDLPAAVERRVAVDAVLGIGATRALSGRHLDAVRWINAHARVFALDVPSGLDADCGAWIDGVPGVRAHATLTFLGAKPGLYMADGCDAAGAVDVDALDAALPRMDGALVDPSCFAAVTAPRLRNTHKGSYGNLAVVGGAAGMVGAALLAARAALRLGAGRVYVDCFGAPELRFDPQQPELMFRALASVRDIDAIVAGCGMGAADAARAQLVAAFGRNVPLVLDADALNLIAAEPSLGVALSALAVPKVLTPHPLEAARLLEVPVQQVQADRIRAARTIAERCGAFVVLKGAGTLIAEPRGRYWINPTGGAALATAGTGDVLAGLIGAFVVQGFDTLEAVLAAVWLHGAAADSTGADVGLVASELPPLVARTLTGLRARPRR
jgi:hydroxyethylthiazole kinase-like uncharacterized protein yjeF